MITYEDFSKNRLVVTFIEKSINDHFPKQYAPE